MDKILDLIKQGKVNGYIPETPEMIMTSMSRVFIFHKNNKALKVYRRDNKYWNESFTDLSGGEVRKKFIKEDFFWNHNVNPEIYLYLRQASVKGGEVIFSELADGDELVTEMNLIDPAHFLIPQLANDVVTLQTNDFYSIGKQMAELKLSLEFKPEIDENWYTLFRERITDIKLWGDSMPDFPKNTLTECLNYFRRYIETNKKEFMDIGPDSMVATIDAHGENALYANGKFSFIDALLPKAIWRLAPLGLDVFRIGADILVLRGEQAYQKYIEGVSVACSLDMQDEQFYLIYGSVMMALIQYTIAENAKSHKSIAEKYYYFLSDQLRKAD